LQHGVFVASDFVVARDSSTYFVSRGPGSVRQDPRKNKGGHDKENEEVAKKKRFPGPKSNKSKKYGNSDRRGMTSLAAVAKRKEKMSK
jgi:hypothetical protein